MLFKNAKQVENFKQYLNSQNMNIKFTSEIKIDNSLSFSVLCHLFANPHSMEFLQIMKALYLYIVLIYFDFHFTTQSFQIMHKF